MDTAVALVGGTGAAGRGLGIRFALAGIRLHIGSRNVDRAQTTAELIADQSQNRNISGHTNQDAVVGSGIVILCVPIAAHAKTLQSIRDAMEPGTILVDATVPLEIAIGGRLSRTISLWDGSAAQQAARLLPDIPVVAAFHSLSAESLLNAEQPLDCDALICSDNPDAKRAVMDLAALIPGVRSIDAGPLENARLLESLAALLISLNLRHRSKHAGIRITGLCDEGKS